MLRPKDIRTLIATIPTIKLRSDMGPGHWYDVPSVGKVFPSVTTVLGLVKDESIQTWKLNRAMDYVFKNHGQFTELNIMEHLTKAKQVSVDIFEEAGDIGTTIHGIREKMFHGEQYRDGFEQMDQRVQSATRALEKFLAETGYIPVASEVMVFDKQLGIAGALDDVGIMPRVTRKGTKDCQHEMVYEPSVRKETNHCLKCPLKVRYDLVIMDLKTSNQFKDHYWVQVALYVRMFRQLTGLKPRRAFILKVSKENGTYQIEDINDVKTAMAAGEHIVKLWYRLELIKKLRKPERIVV